MDETPKDPKVKRPSPELAQLRKERQLLEAVLIECRHMRRTMEKDLLEAQLRQAEQSMPPPPPPVDWMTIAQELIRSGAEIIKETIKDSASSTPARTAEAPAPPQPARGNVHVSVKVR